MPASVVPISAEPRFSLIERDVAAPAFAEDVRLGLTSRPKSLPPRWFYDSLGSSLFDAICFLPEYYVTRAETEVLTASAAEMAAAFGPNVRIVELGSGSARKTRLLLDAASAVEYVPVDVDAGMLVRTGRDLAGEYPALRITAVCSDFSRPTAVLSALPPHRGRTIVLFLGSTIGNLEPDAARAMLTDLRHGLASGDALLLGADLRKSKEILEPAYDDPLGVTAAFNKNVLGRINRELGGAFDLGTFAHRAFYDEALGRIEMHVVSTSSQTVRIEALGLAVSFNEGETIHTESSHKYDDATLAALAGDCGFTIARTWTDSRRWFADLLLVAQ